MLCYVMLCYVMLCYNAIKREVKSSTISLYLLSSFPEDSEVNPHSLQTPPQGTWDLS